jgi:PAT family beta-lactamase induction signal transducer AmpG
MKQPASFTDTHADWRARTTAGVLGVCVLSFVLFWPNRDAVGSGQQIVGTFYTLVFVASALFLLAGREVLGEAAGAWRRAIAWIAPLLLLMYGRYWIDKIPGVLHTLAEVLLYATPLAGGVILIALASRNWSGATRMAEPAVTPADPQPAK